MRIYIPDARYIGAAIAAGSAIGLTVALVRMIGESHARPLPRSQH